MEARTLKGKSSTQDLKVSKDLNSEEVSYVRQICNGLDKILLKAFLNHPATKNKPVKIVRVVMGVDPTEASKTMPALTLGDVWAQSTEHSIELSFMSCSDFMVRYC